MMFNSTTRNFHRIPLLLLSNKCVNINLIKSYWIMQTIRNTKLFFPSYTKNHLSLNSIAVAKFTVDCSKMDGIVNQKLLTYEELLQAQKDGNVLIIDVREQKEIDETGKLPGSIHIPMGTVVNMLNLANDQFQEKFHKSKPDVDSKIILSCKSGMRSATVQKELQKLGFINAYNYAGGWSEWESKQSIK